MFIIKPHIFMPYPEIIFGFSTKIALHAKSPYYFNLSHSVGDDKKAVDRNRKDFFETLGFNNGNVGFQRQIHSDIIKIIDCAGDNGESDALITHNRNLGLAISVADCTPIFIYDKVNILIAAVHSGWRGTERKILLKTLIIIAQKFSSKPENLIVYIGPSILQANYEVGAEVAERFDNSFIKQSGEKFLLDVSGINYKYLLEFGIPKNQIQRSELCTFEYSSLLHSYRRDGIVSGRAMGIIGITE